MPNNTDAQILQVVCRQGRQDRLVDLIFAECRLVPFEAKAPQPTPDVHHRALTLARRVIVYPLTDHGQFDILQSGPGWRGPNANRPNETARVHYAVRRRGGSVAARGARAAAERFPRGLPRTGIANRSDSSKPAPSIFARDARPRLSRGTAVHNGRP